MAKAAHKVPVVQTLTRRLWTRCNKNPTKQHPTPSQTYLSSFNYPSAPIAQD